MNLIEKAVARAKGTPPVSAPDRDGSDPRTFELDYARLAALGLYHPAAEKTPLGAEMRAIRRRLLRRLGLSKAGKALHRRRRRNIVMVSAPHIGAGATFTALNLALSAALEDGMDALLIEGAAGAGERLDLPAGRGFGEWLDGPLEDPAAEIEAFCLRARQAPFRVLRAGGPVADSVADWPAFFADKALGARLAGAAPDGLVVIDAPPALTAQAAALARYADEILIVACAEGTRRSPLVAAIDELVDINPDISLVLNRRPGGDDVSGPEFYEHNQTIQAAEALPHHFAKGALSNDDDIRNGIQKP